MYFMGAVIVYTQNNTLYKFFVVSYMKSLCTYYLLQRLYHCQWDSQLPGFVG